MYRSDTARTRNKYLPAVNNKMHSLIIVLFFCLSVTLVNGTQDRCDREIDDLTSRLTSSLNKLNTAMGKPNNDHIFDNLSNEPTMSTDEVVNRLNSIYKKLTEQSTQARSAAATSRASALLNLISSKQK